MEYDDFSRGEGSLPMGERLDIRGKILYFSGRMLERPDLHPFESP
jgi:hypothetical protein